MSATDISGYKYRNAELNGSHSYLLPATLAAINETQASAPGKTLFDLGCGNGSVTEHVAKSGLKVRGVDVSSEGIAQANLKYPHLDLKVGSAYDDLHSIYGTFSYVLSLEVVEHLYSPKIYAKNIYNLLDDGGYAIISTPYHGYMKNLALAVANKFDKHFTVMWDNGHIKFWSIATMTQLLKEAGFKELYFKRLGRIPPLAKSMMVIARK